MKFKIHFKWNTNDEDLDTVIIEGENVEDVKKNAENWFQSRGMGLQKNGVFSDRIGD